jgi:YfiR/HmsC-like
LPRSGHVKKLAFFRHVVAFAVLVSTAAAAMQLSGAAPPQSDLAALLVNISRYAVWPKSAAVKSLTMCYAHGNSESPPEPRNAAGQSINSGNSAASSQEWTVKGVPVVWMQVASPQQVEGCSLLWLNADVRPAPRAWIAAVADRPVLTMSNYADFTADGGIVGAYRVGPDWRFEINLEALHRSRINIAAAALRLSQKPASLTAPSTLPTAPVAPTAPMAPTPSTPGPKP